jgi:hypothetical protein
MGWLTDLADNAMADGVPVAGIGGVNMQAAPRPAPLSTAGPAPPLLSPAAEARRRKVLAMLARDGGQYAVAVDDAGTDPIILSLATPDGTCEVLIPKDRYDPFAIVARVAGWNREEP